MARLLLLTDALDPSSTVLPALGLLAHHVSVAPADVGAVVLHDATGVVDAVDAVLVDARRDLVHARALCRSLLTVGVGAPLFAVLTEGGLVAVTAEWGLADVLLDTAGPAEVEARLRLATTRSQDRDEESGLITAGALVIDETAYTCTVRGRTLDLTYKEFELLKYLATHPSRVFGRDQLLADVWGEDYYGGTRTVDVHVRRLRAKLGAEHEALIGTVRNVGYRFVPPQEREGTLD